MLIVPDIFASGTISLHQQPNASSVLIILAIEVITL